MQFLELQGGSCFGPCGSPPRGTLKYDLPQYTKQTRVRYRAACRADCDKLWPMHVEELTRPSEIYDSLKRGPLALEELRGLFQYRDLIYQLVRRDVVSRYKRSALGIAWTMLYPLGMMAVLSIVFAQLFHTVPGYPAYILSGLVAWNFFSQSTSAAMTQMVWGSSLLHRIYLPRTAFVVSAIGTGLVNLVIALVPLVLIVLAVGLPLRWSILFLPFSMLLLAAFSLGVGLLFSAWAIYFPDVAEMYQLALLAWLYLTPIIYPEEVIPESYRFWVFHLNPMYYLIKVFRQPVYEGVLPSGSLVAAAVLIALFTLVVGWVVFSSRADEFTYRI
jgi:ABC-2 type transport system permease protein